MSKKKLKARKARKRRDRLHRRKTAPPVVRYPSSYCIHDVGWDHIHELALLQFTRQLTEKNFDLSSLDDLEEGKETLISPSYPKDRGCCKFCEVILIRDIKQNPTRKIPRGIYPGDRNHPIKVARFFAPKTKVQNLTRVVWDVPVCEPCYEFLRDKGCCGEVEFYTLWEGFWEETAAEYKTEALLPLLMDARIPEPLKRMIRRDVRREGLVDDPPS